MIIRGADLSHCRSTSFFTVCASDVRTVPLCWLRSPFSKFSWSGTGSLECCFLVRAGCSDLGEWASWGGSCLSAGVFSAPVGGNTTCQNTALDCPGFLLYRWGLESLWAPCHGSKPGLSLAEPGIVHELVFFIFIPSTNQSAANSVSNFWTRCHE